MLVEAQPMFTKDIERVDYQNKLDEFMALIGLHVSLLFQIAECKTKKKMAKIVFLIW
jgi:hypothetical protein